MLEILAERRMETKGGFYVFRKFDGSIEVEQLDSNHRTVEIYFRDDFEGVWSSTEGYLDEDNPVADRLDSLSKIVFPKNIIYLPSRVFRDFAR